MNVPVGHSAAARHGRRWIRGVVTAGVLATVTAVPAPATHAAARPVPASLSSTCTDLQYSCVAASGYNASTVNRNWANLHYGAGGGVAVGNPPHNCTLYAAWRLADNGLPDPGVSWGNAFEWGHRLAHDTTPAVGAIAWYDAHRIPAVGYLGHVAYVAKVDWTTRQVFLESDNASTDTSVGHTSSGWVPFAEPSGYIHLRDQLALSNSIDDASAGGDFDGDGRRDLLLATPQGANGLNFQVRLSAGLKFADPAVWADTNGNYNVNDSRFIAGDYNGDQKTDLLLITPRGASGVNLTVAESSGHSFSSPAPWGDTLNDYNVTGSRFLTGDFDGDGRSDVLMITPRNATGLNMQVRLSTGHGFGPASVWSNTGADYTVIDSRFVVGDVNGDGRSDLILLTPQGASGLNIQAMMSNGSGFSSGQLWGTTNGQYTVSDSRFVAGDFNGDGRSDLLALTPQGTSGLNVQVMVSNGSSFSSGQLWMTTNGNYNVTDSRFSTADFNGDGRSDVLLATPQGASGLNLQVMLSNGSSFWSADLWGSTNGVYTVTDSVVLASPADSPAFPYRARSIVAAAGDAKARVSWTEPAFTGSSPITGYTIRVVPNGPVVHTDASSRTATVSGLTNGTTYTFAVTAQNTAGSGPAATSNSVVPVAGALPPPPSGGAGTVGYTSMTPVRLLDTRPGYQTVDGLFAGIGLRSSGSETEVWIAGRGGVPGTSTAASLNVTVVAPTAPGFLTVYPCRSPRPNAANLTYETGDVISNAVLAGIGEGGHVCLYTSAAAHLVVDVNGAVAGTTDYVASVPARVLDTRPASPTVDGQFTAAGQRPAGSVTELQLAGRAGVPADASAAAINLAVTDTDGPGYVTVYPCGSPRPNAANLNYAAHQTIANLVIAKIDPNGRVCIYTYAGTHLVADVNGYMPAATSYEPLVPARLLDTRAGFATVDGNAAGGGQGAAGTVTELQVAGRGGVPATTGAVVLNVTVVDPAGPGFVTVYPCGGGRPNAANLTYAARQTIPNLVVAQVDATGKVCIYTYAATHLVADINGNFPNG